MKSTGIVRKIDELGRIVIPRELRRTLGIEIKDSLEIFLEDNKIILRKYQVVEECCISGEISPDNLILAKGNIVLSYEEAEKLIQELEKKLSSIQTLK